MKHHTTALLVTLAMLLGLLPAASLAQPPKGTSSVISNPPSEMAPPPGIVGPTENITKVAQAIITRAKSLTTLVVVAPGLQLTQPVTISIGYYSPAGSNRITQTYVVSGNHFLHNDAVGDGKPRQMNMHITFEEPRAGGGVYTFTWSMSLLLDPLYDVMISPLSFTLFTDCDWIGKSEISLFWTSPESVPVQRFDFSTRAGDHTTIDAFAWSRQEVSASGKLHMPWIHFVERDPQLPGSFPHGFVSGTDALLLPGTTRQVVQTLTENENQCSASVQYDITYTLRWYPYL
jgi:hypothetical protein